MHNDLCTMKCCPEVLPVHNEVLPVRKELLPVHNEVLPLRNEVLRGSAARAQ